ncbi:MAG: hypothetical protein JWL61_4058 [Gemmatimonadetes bacterium]|nr:hypothetical protein [Gemmatimonadota bacterium]
MNVVTPGIFTKRDIAALRARGEELSNQITSASGRRRQTREALKTATGADKAGLEQRLGVLDARIARLETDIDENGKLLASIPAQLVGSTGTSFNPGGPNFRGNSDNMIPIAAIFTVFVLAPIAFSIARLVWKRGSLRHVAQAQDINPRLERMEQAIEAIAIEMERVSEGQRFVTRIMSESRSVGEGQRVAQPLPIPIGETAAAPRY